MRTLVLASLLLPLWGCGGKHPGTYEAGQATREAEAEGELEELLAQAREAWDDRLEAESLLASMEAYEQVASLDPEHREALERLTRGLYFYGDAFLTDPDEQEEYWSQAISWGTRCLGLNPDIARAIEEGAREHEAAEQATAQDVPCLYWTATALGKWGRLQGISTLLRHQPTVRGYIGKAEELEPSYFHYGPVRYWGAYYSALPGFAGKDLERSAEYFEAAIEGAPGYLGTRVLRAEFLAVELRDPELFRQELEYVLDADPEALPEAAAENVKEQEKARRLLESKGDFF